MENKGEKTAELPTMGEVAQIEGKMQMEKEQTDSISKRTLKIWDVPEQMAMKFIGTARASYANKSWLYLQDLMRKADLYDQLVSSGRMEDHERRIASLEDFIMEIQKEPQKEPEKKANNKPKTFGDG